MRRIFVSSCLTFEEYMKQCKDFVDILHEVDKVVTFLEMKRGAKKDKTSSLKIEMLNQDFLPEGSRIIVEPQNFGRNLFKITYNHNNNGLEKGMLIFAEKIQKSGILMPDFIDYKLGADYDDRSGKIPPGILRKLEINIREIPRMEEAVEYESVEECIKREGYFSERIKTRDIYLMKWKYSGEEFCSTMNSRQLMTQLGPRHQQGLELMELCNKIAGSRKAFRQERF